MAQPSRSSPTAFLVYTLAEDTREAIVSQSTLHPARSGRPFMAAHLSSIPALTGGTHLSEKNGTRIRRKIIRTHWPSSSGARSLPLDKQSVMKFLKTEELVCPDSLPSFLGPALFLGTLPIEEKWGPI